MKSMNPVAKLLMYAHSDEQIEYDEMTRWADEFGIPRREMIDLHEQALAERCSCSSFLRPSREATETFDALKDAVARAYVEGWIGLGRVILWAEEREFDEEQIMAILERCAEKGHAQTCSA